MHSFELRHTIDQVLLDVADAEPLFTAVATLSMVFDAMTEPLLVIAEGGNKLPEATAALHARFAGLSRVTAGINPRRFYQGLERLQQGLARMRSPALPDDKLISELSSGVEEFAAVYDAFLARPSGKTAIPLILQARTLNDRLPVLMNTLAALRSRQADSGTLDERSAEMTLSLPAVSTLPDFARRLLALDTLYNETCVLMGISRSEQPLRISKIESGSLWARVVGDRRAIAWLCEFLQDSASFMYQNYTADAKLAGAGKTIEAIDAVLRLSQRLKDAGLDAARVPQHVARCAPSLFKELGTLIEGQPSITVNQVTVSIGDELNKLLLKGHALAA